MMEKLPLIPAVTLCQSLRSPGLRDRKYVCTHYVVMVINLHRHVGIWVCRHVHGHVWAVCHGRLVHEQGIQEDEGTDVETTGCCHTLSLCHRDRCWQTMAPSPVC